MTTYTPTPLLFISHGAPTFALEPGKLGPQLNAWVPNWATCVRCWWYPRIGRRAV